MTARYATADDTSKESEFTGRWAPSILYQSLQEYRAFNGSVAVEQVEVEAPLMLDRRATAAVATEPPNTDIREETNHHQQVQTLLDHVQAQPASQQIGDVTVTSGQFTSGETGSIVDTGTSRQQVFVYQSSAGAVEYYLIEDGVLGRQLTSGDALDLENGASVSVDADSGDLLLSGIPSAGLTQGARIHSDSAGVSIRVYAEGIGFQYAPTHNLATGATLMDASKPVGANLSADELFAYYSDTPEGQAILERERAHYDIYNTSGVLIGNSLDNPRFQELFVARVRYNRGEGGVELFEAFMPVRSSLDAAGRAEYDLQLERILSHVQNNSVVLGEGSMSLGPFDNIPVPQAMDPSLQFLIASGLAEVVGNNPELVGRVLSDLDRGWAVSVDGSHLDDGVVGSYDAQRRGESWESWLHSDHAGITFDLHALLGSYVDPHDRDDIVGHEIAHSLDAYNSSRGGNGTDGVPSNMDENDREIFLGIRHEYFTSYINAGFPSGPGVTHLGLQVYAFTNPEEFWAEVSEEFLSGQDAAAKIHSESPELYGVLSRFYDIQYPGLVPT